VDRHLGSGAGRHLDRDMQMAPSDDALVDRYDLLFMGAMSPG
jgi:hypothetical protein